MKNIKLNDDSESSKSLEIDSPYRITNTEHSKKILVETPTFKDKYYDTSTNKKSLV
jgi:hypothetical protein